MRVTRMLLLEYNLQFFAKDGPGGEKTEEPTAKKLEDARKEGQVAKSKELANAAGLFALFLLLDIYAGTMGTSMMEYLAGVYNQIPDVIQMYDGRVPVASLMVLLRGMVLQLTLICAPVLLVGLIVAVICDIMQVGWKPTAKPMQPKFSKINPLKGFQRIFSSNSIVELVKSIAKIFFISYIAYSYLKGRADEVYLLYDMPITQAIGLVGEIITQMGIRIAAVYMVIAILDFAYQKWKFRNDMKMTKQEIKDEYKNQEGDPQVKGKQKQRMREASMRRMMQQLPEADVVITNPTHYAVAIKYDPDKYDAPYVLAKGENYLAQRIKEIAKENEIEILENKPLARMLYANVEIGGLVPPELYQAVAEVLAFVYHLKGKV